MLTNSLPFFSALLHSCWLESTFSVSDAAHKTVGIEVAYPGVKMQNPAQGERKVYHKVSHPIISHCDLLIGNRTHH